MTAAGPELVGAALTACTVLAWPWRAQRLPPGRRGPHPPPASGPAAALPAPVVLELVCAALEAGLPTGAALEAALAVAGSEPGERAVLAAPPGRRASAAARQWVPMARALDLADRTGASAAVLLRSAAGDERARRRAAVRLASARLGVRLVIPLGLTVLPAFVLLGVAPVVLGLAARVLSSPP